MYEWFEHTADLGLRVRASDLPGLFCDAARGLLAMAVEPEPHGAALGRREFRIEAESHELLLFDWLAELLYVFDSERVLLGDFETTIDETGLRGSAAVFDLDRGGYRLLREVKAITYHGLKVERTPEGWLAEIIVDI